MLPNLCPVTVPHSRGLQSSSPTHLRGVPAPPSLGAELAARPSLHVPDTDVRENAQGWGHRGRRARLRTRSQATESGERGDRDIEDSAVADRPGTPRRAGRKAGRGRAEAAAGGGWDLPLAAAGSRPRPSGGRRRGPAPARQLPAAPRGSPCGPAWDVTLLSPAPGAGPAVSLGLPGSSPTPGLPPAPTRAQLQSPTSAPLPGSAPPPSISSPSSSVPWPRALTYWLRVCC